MTTPTPINVNDLIVTSIQVMITAPPADPDGTPSVTYSEPIAVPQFDDGRRPVITILHFTVEKKA
jgi:hypothetical protein